MSRYLIEAILNLLKLTQDEKTVLMVLARFARNDGTQARPGIDTVVELSGMSRRQVFNQGVQTEIDRLVTALAAGVAVDSITAGLKERETAKQALNARLEHLDGRARAAQVDRQALRATLGDWKKKLSGNPVVARQVLSRLLTERIAFHPDGDGGGSFEGRCSYAAFLVLKNAFTATGRVPEGFTEAHGRCIIPRGKTGTSGEP